MSGTSWGRYPQPHDQRLLMLRDRDAPLPELTGTALPYGNGRSYGDSCLNSGGTLLCTRGLDRFIAFDAERGLLRCEAGVTGRNQPCATAKSRISDSSTPASQRSTPVAGSKPM